MLRTVGAGERPAQQGAAERPVEERHRLIDQAHHEAVPLSLRQMCALFGASRSWYYACPSPEERAVRDVARRDAIEALLLEFPGSGSRRVTHALARAGWSVNHQRVLRVMREESLLCHLKRRFVPTVTTDSRHGFPTSPNLLAAAGLTAPDRAWVADITSIRLPTTFVYLACLLDAYSRRCVGWHLSRQIDAQLTLAALEQALSRRQPPPGLIHHSDRGVQYACTAYVARRAQGGARLSLSAVGNPYDNAKAESVFKTLQHEEVYLTEYRTFAEAEANIGQFIEDVYNTKRLHSSLGYLPPAEFEATCHCSPQELTLPLVR